MIEAKPPYTKGLQSFQSLSPITGFDLEGEDSNVNVIGLLINYKKIKRHKLIDIKYILLLSFFSYMYMYINMLK